MADPVRRLKAHAEKGDTLMIRLRYAGTRPDAARHVRALRRWHQELLPITEACGVTLAPAGKYYPTDREVAPVASTIANPFVTDRRGRMPEAQRRMLVVTAAALSRLAPQLATAKPIPPKRKGGRPQKDPLARIEAVETELYEQRRRRERRNKEGAIKTVLLSEGLEIGSAEFEQAFERLKKRDSL